MQNNHPTDLDALRDQLIQASLPHVVFDGWSDTALAAGAQDLKLDPTMPQRLFGGGAADAVAHMVRMADRQMLADAAAADLSALGDRARLSAIVKLRLDRWLPHREAIRRALGVLAMPRNILLTTQLAWGTVDAIWTASGKRSHDVSWYTRRATLAAVYAATLVIWLDDQTEDCSETFAFLAHRLDEVTGLIKLRHQAWTWLTRRVPGLVQPG